MYLTKIKETPIRSAEISELGWFSKDDIINEAVKVPPAFREKLYPKLIDDNLL